MLISKFKTDRMLAVFWFRRDLRLEDNVALWHALRGDLPVLPIFIFDSNIVDELPEDDARLNFIYDKLFQINVELKKYNSGILVLKGNPIEIWTQLLSDYELGAVYVNKDYEPYALNRDTAVTQLLKSKGIEVFQYKDQVVFEENEILKNDGTPYTVFTPYKRKWLEKYSRYGVSTQPSPGLNNFFSGTYQFPSKVYLGIKSSSILVKDYNLSNLKEYSKLRNLPAEDATSYLSTHLRFGTVSIRQVIIQLKPDDEVFFSELIWREFFMQILYHYPRVVGENFREKYNGIKWRNNAKEFELWCQGKTGYPLVDAGMRQLNSTGFMHNRVRMVTASFLCKHLLIDWRWGEAYFAEKLLDFELSSNNGNWQWAAGTGCDAAPYFRIFNPIEQQKKFDKNFEYVKKWLPEYGTKDYPYPIVEHKFARVRALSAYKEGILTKRTQ